MLNLKNKVKALKQSIELAKGEAKAELLFKNARVVNVYTGESYLSNILVDRGNIIGISDDYNNAQKIIDCEGLYALPGFIDGHIHIESSLLHPTELARLLLLNGTTTIIADPHEISNVLGSKGIDYLLNATEKLPLDVFVMIPSCVPSSNLETTGGKITVTDIKKYLQHPRVLGLAELMNFPGVITVESEVLEKIATVQASAKLIDGHCPRLKGKYLQAYIGAGIMSDHECISPQEAQEKLRLGMYLMIREGSAAKNLADLLPIITPRNIRRCLLISDDIHPDYLLKEGHLNAVLRKAVSLGLDPYSAIQMATINSAEYFRLYDRGAIAPGKKADIVFVGNLTDFNVKLVVKNGKIIIKQGEFQTALPVYKDPAVTSTMNVKPFNVAKLKVRAKTGYLNVIKVLPGQIVTEKLTVVPKVIKSSSGDSGEVVSDLERDILKVVVVERHKKTGNIGIGFVSGFGFKKGAIASSVAHDAHNIIAVGTNDLDIYLAIKEIIRLRGGLVAVSNGKIKASLELPIAGLMSNKPCNVVAEKLQNLINICHAWQCKLENPFITLSFLALPVIPTLKITDYGLIDVSSFHVVDLFTTES
ncbi:MAG: adenine deaminase [candidate division WOR-3 bacterium]|nr:adenine deaminase [candidate division WOR-3 bacterium]